jgi:hypothetical protein
MTSDHTKRKAEPAGRDALSGLDTDHGVGPHDARTGFRTTGRTSSGSTQGRMPPRMELILNAGCRGT